MKKKRVDGSTTELQKVQSLKGRWFKVKLDDVEKIDEGKNSFTTVGEVPWIIPCRSGLSVYLC